MSDVGVDEDRARGRSSASTVAVACIAGVAALGCHGVVGIASRRIKGGRAQILDAAEIARGVAVTVAHGSVTVDVYLVVAYGKRISDVAHNVINAVGQAVQSTLGELPVRVNVNVQGLRLSA